MEPMANIALRAAREAAKHIIRAFDRPDLVKVESKGHNDPVTNVDREAEGIIIDMLHKTYPDHSIIGEESVRGYEKPGAEFEWIIDPIDGTINFSRQIPHFSVSVACRKRGKLEHGVIIDPFREEEFVASRGKGCSMNGRAVRVSGTDGVDGAVIATGGRYHSDEAQASQVALYGDLLAAGTILRQPGSACLELAYVAAGRLDGMWMRGISAWDMAAGALMVTEAGGLVGEFSGGANYLETGNIVAASPRVFKQFAPLVKKHFR